MKNPLNNIQIYQISFYTKKQKQQRTIVVEYKSGSGNAVAFEGYSDKVIARTRGFGYDKMSTALLEAIEKLTDKELDANGAVGHQAVVDAARKQGIKVTSII